MRSSEQKRSNKRIGALGESIACNFLLSKGFAIVERNFTATFGEIDIVATKDGNTHFIEVKTAVSRESSGFSGKDGSYRPEELVHKEKIDKIRRLAEFYLVSREITSGAQVDVVAVYLQEETMAARCFFIEQAGSL